MYTLQLRSMHEDLFLHESMRAMIVDIWEAGASNLSATCSTALAGARWRSSQMILRNLLGLKPLGERQPTSLWRAPYDHKGNDHFLGRTPFAQDTDAFATYIVLGI